MALKSSTMILSRLAPYDETDIPPAKKRQLILKSIPPNKVASLVLLAIEFSSVAQVRSLTERITEICGRNSATLSSFVSFYCHSSLYHLKLMAKILCKEFNDRADHRPIIFLVNMKSLLVTSCRAMIMQLKDEEIINQMLPSSWFELLPSIKFHFLRSIWIQRSTNQLHQINRFQYPLSMWRIN